jgi:hypothetical protein
MVADVTEYETWTVHTVIKENLLPLPKIYPSNFLVMQPITLLQ